MRLVDAFTNYRSRYGYPAFEALVAELWWRLEHLPWGEWRTEDGGRWQNLWASVRTFAYRQRKGWERRGIAKRVGEPGR